MNIVFYNHSMEMGGIERTIASLSGVFCEEHKVTILQYTKGTSAYELDKRVRHIAFGYDARGNKMLRILRLYRTVRKTLKELKPDIIFCMSKTHLQLFCVAARGLRAVVIGAERSNPLLDRSRRAAKLRAMSARADGFVFQTARAMEAYPEKTRQKGIVIPNAVCNPDVLSVPADLPKEKKFVSVGRLEKVKGYDLLIEAFSRIAAELSDWSLVIYGEGTQQDSLQAQIDRAGLSGRARLAGGDVHAFLKVARCEIFVLSSRSEGMPNTLMEALACATACIAADCPNGPAELIENGKNGLLVPAQDVPALADAMRALAENEAQRRAFTREAAAFREAHALPVIANRWLIYATERLEQKRRG